ncbi:palmitoyltransferase PFA3 NDAI_0G01340 [Naumovozyma dairenensis CBS 421]|uniref:Palmitoyltransferase n=1 Tax=Naumovozyma dairenensis (strain ATCC 10597 / BCRC 20456 / CBS 421 / NBRC 0211 / NRRL Y-12639) TaxID=1071378 RepID=G0WDP9_NAUDC|nr:hypothetical protein NDAI_0G01340 [Naumovozyma dairenensis CBS 421]CCD25910.2 hypothetical protein NDAI_0G01340 [Naumovozyma dairenensis CBS 421]
MQGGTWSTISTLFPRCLTTFLFLWTSYVIITRINTIPTIPPHDIDITINLYFHIFIFQNHNNGTRKSIRLPRSISRKIYMMQDLVKNYHHNILTKKSYTMKRNGRYRLCQTCQVWKPDRCHHCSTCNKCILKMDHHCPWFAECIGFKNQKFFIQFLIYCTIYAFVALGLISYQFVNWYKNQNYMNEYIDFTLLIVGLLAFVISISVLAFSSFSIYQVLKNRTTIEMYGIRRYNRDFAILNGTEESDFKNIFELDSNLLNWKEVMGDSWIEWIFPIVTFKISRNRHSTDEKGLYFNINSHARREMLDSIDLQDRLLRRVTPRSSVESTRPLIIDDI